MKLLITFFVVAICSGITMATSPIRILPEPIPEPLILPAPDSPNCNIMCTMDYRPVCGLPINQCGDCRTFGNGCSLGVYNCQNPGNQYYAYAQGECESIGKPILEDIPVEILA